MNIHEFHYAPNHFVLLHDCGSEACVVRVKETLEKLEASQKARGARGWTTGEMPELLRREVGS